MRELLTICLGGALGTGARFLLGGFVQRAAGGAFPWGTIAVNAIGCFAIMVVTQAGLGRHVMSAEVRGFLATGVLGGFTTYSSFNHASLRFAEEGALVMAVANIGVTLVACLMAGALGLLAARWLAGGVGG